MVDKINWQKITRLNNRNGVRNMSNIPSKQKLYQEMYLNNVK